MYICTHLLQNMTVFGYFLPLVMMPLVSRCDKFSADSFCSTTYLMFGFSGDAKIRYGFVIPMATVITRKVSCVTVAVKAIILTADGMRLRTSPKRE